MTVYVSCPLKRGLMCAVIGLVYETPCPGCPYAFNLNVDALGTSAGASSPTPGARGLEAIA